MSEDRRGMSPVDLMIAITVVGILAAIAVPNFVAIQERSKLMREAEEQLLLVCSEAQDYYRIHGMWPPHDWEIRAMTSVDALMTTNFRYAQDTGKNKKEFIAHATGFNPDGSINHRVATVRVVWGDAPKFTYQGF